LPVITPAGARIPLEDVADIKVTDGPPMIKSENARLNGWVYVDIRDRDLSSYVNEARARVAAEVELPPGYSLAWSGQYEYMERAVERLSVVVPVTLFIIFILLYLNFRSLADVCLIMATLPFAFGGGVWLLYLLDFNLSIAVGIGFIALAGVAVESGIVMLEFLKKSLTSVHFTGKKPEAAVLRNNVVNAAEQRLRPIMMTACSTIAGLLPIMLIDGTGSEVMQRVAAPMIGGVLSSTMLTLVVIPVIFYKWKCQ